MQNERIIQDYQYCIRLIPYLWLYFAPHFT